MNYTLRGGYDNPRMNIEAEVFDPGLHSWLCPQRNKSCIHSLPEECVQSNSPVSSLNTSTMVHMGYASIWRFPEIGVPLNHPSCRLGFSFWNRPHPVTSWSESSEVLGGATILVAARLCQAEFQPGSGANFNGVENHPGAVGVFRWELGGKSLSWYIHSYIIFSYYWHGLL